MSLRKNDTFLSRAEMEAKLADYEKSTKQKFTKGHSKTLKLCYINGKPRDLIAEGYAAELYYYEIEYVCQFGGQLRSKSTGMRTNSSKKTGCPAKIKIKAKDHNNLSVIDMKIDHNHELIQNELTLPDNASASEKQSTSIDLSSSDAVSCSTCSSEQKNINDILDKLRNYLSGLTDKDLLSKIGQLESTLASWNKIFIEVFLSHADMENIPVILDNTDFELPMTSSIKSIPERAISSSPASESVTKFEDQAESTKINIILKWLVPENLVEDILSERIMINVKHTEEALKDMPDPLIDSDVDISMIKKYFTAPTFRKLSNAIKKKKESKTFLCPTCKLPDREMGDWIQCDSCLLWYHFECVGLKESPGEYEDWFCMICNTMNNNTEDSAHAELKKN